MSIDKLIKMNDWNIKNFIIIILAIQLAMWSLIGLDILNYHIPIIRQLIGFIYLTYIPGIIFLRILRLHGIGSLEVLLYSIGSSIAFTMFAGALVNLIFIIFRIPRPISIIPITIALSILILAMCAFCYIMRKETMDNMGTNINTSINTSHKDMPLAPIIALSIIPLICVIGTYLVNFYNNNILLMSLIIIISATIIFVTLKSKNMSALYPYAVFIISISLLFHNSLISMYIHNWDIHIEYHLANSVLINNLWDYNIFSPANSMLSVVTLAPIYSIMLNLDLTWVFKIVYPLIFALIPVGLYRVFQRQTNDVIAFLSCMFFISFFAYYTEMLALARQEIAELFFVLLILLIISNEIELKKRMVLVAVFSASLIVSHYGLSYIYLFFIIAVFSIDKIKHYLSKSMGRLKLNFDNPLEKENMISLPYILLFIMFMLIWYTYTSRSSNITNIIWVLSIIIKNALVDILNPASSQGLELILSNNFSIIHTMAKYYHMLSQGLIVLGLAITVIKVSKTKFNSQYLSLSFMGLLFCIFGIVVPFFASSLNTERLYQIAIIVLSPFCIIGLLYLIESANTFIHKLTRSNLGLNINLILSIFVVIFLLINVGFIYELLNDSPTSASLSQENIEKYGSMTSKSEVLYNEINTFDQDINSITWCKNSLDFGLHEFYTDINTLHPCISYGMFIGPNIIEGNNIIPVNDSDIDPGSYLLFGYPSVKDNIVRVGFSKTISMSDVLNSLPNNKIYDNGGGEVYISA